MENPWQKVWSKRHQRDYWFNSQTNEKRWVEPEEMKNSRKRPVDALTSSSVPVVAASASSSSTTPSSSPELRELTKRELKTLSKGDRLWHFYEHDGKHYEVVVTDAKRELVSIK